MAGWASELVWTQRLEEKSFAPADDRTTVNLEIGIHLHSLLGENSQIGFS
jgi:hypothetical protein